MSDMDTPLAAPSRARGRRGGVLRTTPSVLGFSEGGDASQMHPKSPISEHGTGLAPVSKGTRNLYRRALV
jgi:hypothetical protein